MSKTSDELYQDYLEAVTIANTTRAATTTRSVAGSAAGPTRTARIARATRDEDISWQLWQDKLKEEKEDE